VGEVTEEGGEGGGGSDKGGEMTRTAVNYLIDLSPFTPTSFELTIVLRATGIPTTTAFSRFRQPCSAPFNPFPFRAYSSPPIH